MFDKSTLEALQESASIAEAARSMNGSGNTHNAVALPSDYKLHDMEPYQALRRRARGIMTTSSLDAFSEYTKDHAGQGASVFVHADTMSATAVLNLGTPDEPGHADNKALLVVKRTAAFNAMMFIANGAGQKQTTVAEFMEDWSEHIECCNESGLISGGKAVAAVRKLTIETMRKLESEEQQLSTSRSAFESVQATSTAPIPTIIKFSCQPYVDMSERAFGMRLVIKTDGDKPTILLRIIRFEKCVEDIAQELAARIEAGFTDGAIPVLIGTYQKA